MTSLRTITAPLLISALFLMACYALYGSAGHDDSHITFWASYTLSEFGEILNYNGDRIEQSSSLLLTLLIALLAWLTNSDVVIMGYLFTYLCGAIAIGLCWHLAKHCQLNKTQGLFVIIALATSPAFLLWNTSGMESTLAASCIIWFVLCWGNLLNEDTAVSSRSITWAALASTALLLVRPEMISLCAAVLFLFFIWRRFTGNRGNLPILIFYSTVLLCICLLIGWRYFYFHLPMPLPVYAKVSGMNLDKIGLGTYYFFVYAIHNIVLTIGAISVVLYLIHLLKNRINSTGTNHHLLLSALILFSYSSFIIISGGDWMQAGRFFVPILPLAAIHCFNLANKYNTPLTASLFILAIVLCFNGCGNYLTLKELSHGTPIWADYRINEKHQQRYSRFEQWNQEHLRDMEIIDHLDQVINQLKENNPQPVTLMSGQSGMVYFYTAKQHFKEVRFYDSRGLTEKSLLKCALIDDVPRSRQGLYFGFNDFFIRQPGLFEVCGIPEPDILYDINDYAREMPKQMAAHGYTLIHKEGGGILQNKSIWPAKFLPASNIIMVANDLLPVLNHSNLTHIRYKDKPLASR